jgi:hypothetical protein
LILGINFAAVPNEGTLVAGLAIVALASGIAFVIRQRRAANPLYDLHVAGRRCSGSPRAPGSSCSAR